MTRDQALRSGLSAAAWRRAVAAGELLLMHPGVAVLASEPSSDAQAILAGVLACGRGAMASHRSSLALWGVRIVSPVVDVMVPIERRPRPKDGIAIHRSRCPIEQQRRWRSGVPCTSPIRALVDSGALVSDDVVADVLAQLAVSRLVSPSVAAATVERFARHGHEGAATLRRVVEGWPKGVEDPDSVLEVRLARLLVADGLGGFHFHARICGFEVDFAYPPQRLVVETDGYEFHGSRDAFEVDRHRDATLVAAGWRVVRVTWRQLEDEPHAVLGRVRGALGTAATRGLRSTA